MNRLHTTNRCPSAVIFLIFSVVLSTYAFSSDIGDKMPITDICSILKNPDKFVNKKIKIEGYLNSGMDLTNISSNNCNDAIFVTVGDVAYKKKSIRDFYTKLHSRGGRGMATIVGIYKSSDTPVAGHAFDLQEVLKFEPEK